MKKIIILAFFIFFSFNFVSSLVIDNVNQEKLYPGESASINIDVKNNFNDDVEDVSLSLDLTNTLFTSIGSSEQSVDEIREDKTETFDYEIKASQNLKPGDYNLPYILSYNNGTAKIDKKGTIGVSVGARTEIDYIADVQNPVIGQQGKISLKVVNKGLGEIRFISIKIIPKGFTLLSNNVVYIGSVNSDDFETASFDVLFKDPNAKFAALIEYKDFENKKITQNIELPLEIYTSERALELGIIKKDNTLIYVSVILAALVIFFIWRIIKKRKKKNQRA